MKLGTFNLSGGVISRATPLHVCNPEHEEAIVLSGCKAVHDKKKVMMRKKLKDTTKEGFLQIYR